MICVFLGYRLPRIKNRRPTIFRNSAKNTFISCCCALNPNRVYKSLFEQHAKKQTHNTLRLKKGEVLQNGGQKGGDYLSTPSIKMRTRFLLVCSELKTVDERTTRENTCLIDALLSFAKHTHRRTAERLEKHSRESPVGKMTQFVFGWRARWSFDAFAFVLMWINRRAIVLAPAKQDNGESQE